MSNKSEDSLREYMGTKYMAMMLKDVSLWDNALAILFTWIVLAGFLILPGSFGTISKLPINGQEFKSVISSLQHLPLLVMGFSCSALGGIGMCYLWWCHGTNYAWLVNSIFVPGWLSGLSGLISTFMDIYANKNGAYSVASIAVISATGGCAAICGFLAAFHSFWLVRRLKKERYGV